MIHIPRRQPPIMPRDAHPLHTSHRDRPLHYKPTRYLPIILLKRAKTPIAR